MFNAWSASTSSPSQVNTHGCRQRAALASLPKQKLLTMSRVFSFFPPPSFLQYWLTMCFKLSCEPGGGPHMSETRNKFQQDRAQVRRVNTEKRRDMREREKRGEKVVIYKSAADIFVTNTDRRGVVAAHMTAHWPPSLTSVTSAQSCITVKTTTATTTKQREK